MDFQENPRRHLEKFEILALNAFFCKKICQLDYQLRFLQVWEWQTQLSLCIELMRIFQFIDIRI